MIRLARNEKSSLKKEKEKYMQGKRKIQNPA
jgi:hypothetical protein